MTNTGKAGARVAPLPSYLGLDGRGIHWACIRALFASVASLAIVPLQDILGLGSHARMNRPAQPKGNWKWRFTEEVLDENLAERLGSLTRLYGQDPTPGNR